MNMPWRNTTGLAKAVAIFATGLAICFGLCGLNFIAVVSGVGNAGNILGVTAYLELAGMLICATGLIALLVGGMFQAAYLHFFGHSELSKLNLRQPGSADAASKPKSENKDQ